jgi:hypothetical protein
MKFIFLFIIISSIYSCSKPKAVFICGDHVCINGSEAEQYFEDNLTLEVKIINNNKKKNVDLIQMNLKENLNGRKKISLLNKNKTKNFIKILSESEIKEKKIEIKKRKKIKIQNLKGEKKNKIIKKKEVKKILNTKEVTKKNINKSLKNAPNNTVKKIVNKKPKEIDDICAILKKCSIDEISRYLIKKGKAAKFPDITKRE